MYGSYGTEYLDEARAVVHNLGRGRGEGASKEKRSGICELHRCSICFGIASAAQRGRVLPISVLQSVDSGRASPNRVHWALRRKA